MGGGGGGLFSNILSASRRMRRAVAKYIAAVSMSFPERFLQRRKPVPLPGNYQHYAADSTTKANNIDINKKYHASKENVSWTMGPARTLAPDSSLTQASSLAREEFLNYAKNTRTSFNRHMAYNPLASAQHETIEGDAGCFTRSLVSLLSPNRLSSG